MATPFDDDKLHDECGIFGIYNHDDASAHVALGLHALQHRGQEACGIVTNDDDQFHIKRALGLVDDTFGDKKTIESLKGKSGIGHNRYATTGETHLRNVQPLHADMDFGGFAVAHNGNLTNAMTIKKELVSRGAIFQSTSDTEVIIHLVATSTYRTLLDKVIDALKQVEGA